VAIGYTEGVAIAAFTAKLSPNLVDHQRDGCTSGVVNSKSWIMWLQNGVGRLLEL